MSFHLGPIKLADLPDNVRLEATRDVVREGIHTPFWEWLKSYLEYEKTCAINLLTTIDPTPDNLGQIAAAQERLRFATVLLRTPEDLLRDS